MSMAGNARNTARSALVRSKPVAPNGAEGFDGAEDVAPKKSTSVSSSISATAVAKSTQDFSHSDSVADSHEPNIVDKIQYDRAEPEGAIMGDESGGLPQWLFVLCAA